EIAAVKHLKEELLVFHILLTSNFTATICSFTMNPEETDMILTHPRCVVCTDGGARALTGPLSKGKPHPRVFGTFPKFFRNYVKEKKKLTLSEAVAKTTARTAELFNIKNRGMIKPGYFADIIVINWEEFTDTATYENPKSFPQGIIAVIVNGKPVFLNGTYTDARPGRLLLR
ncbi:MAG: amidohydrolase family protein, partial [Candidatus Sumerlaeia bacterium]|nr:amidohydrolase family protein [Candidatus Sumerlaeia bacterium]